LYSFHPRTAPNIEALAPNGIKLQVSRIPLANPGIATNPPHASETTIDGLSGWQTVRIYPEQVSGGKTHAIWLEKEGYRYSIAAGFQNPHVDETVFLQILSTVQLH
jgi:hypothetical protein